ncbi:MAG: hypothetical protein H7343_19165 [Undibacterium sp.]|nr:hypothetical protein [Opitutaceae bacterium]
MAHVQTSPVPKLATVGGISSRAGLHRSTVSRLLSHGLVTPDFWIVSGEALQPLFEIARLAEIKAAACKK